MDKMTMFRLIFEQGLINDPKKDAVAFYRYFIDNHGMTVEEIEKLLRELNREDRLVDVRYRQDLHPKDMLDHWWLVTPGQPRD